MTVYKTRKIGDIRGGQSKYFYGEVMGGGGARIRGTPVKVKGVKKKAKDKVETSQDLLDKAYIKKFGPPPKAPPKVKAKAPPKVESKKEKYYRETREKNPASGPTHMKPSAAKKVKKKVKEEDSPAATAVKPKSTEKPSKGKQNLLIGTAVTTSALILANQVAQEVKQQKKSDSSGSKSSDFGSSTREAINRARGGKHDRPKAGTLGRQSGFPLDKVVTDTRAKKTGNRPTTGESGDGPRPKELKAPESDRKKDSRLDFETYNKAGSKLGMKLDDMLRGAFSFMGTLPKSTDEDKWKNKR
jgi:hypothetical protein